jgi:hypothetical protein
MRPVHHFVATRAFWLTSFILAGLGFFIVGHEVVDKWSENSLTLEMSGSPVNVKDVGELISIEMSTDSDIILNQDTD